MKLTVFIMSCLAVTSFGQITLEVTDFADGGDTVRMSSATDPEIDILSTGPNYTWDYSDLIAESQELKTYNSMADASNLATFIFGGFAPPAYQATNFAASTNIPLDQLGGTLPVDISEINLFSKNSSSAINSIGYSMVVSGTEVPFKSDTIETRYELPLDFGDSYFSNGYTNLDLNPIYNGMWIQHRTRSSSVDGWGTITTPFGTYDAIRVHHEITEIDSIQLEIQGAQQWIPIPVPNSSIYEWWAKDQLEPILRISTSEVLGATTVTGIEYRDTYNPLIASIENISSRVKIYPNPVVNELNLEGIDAGMMYMILDHSGKVYLNGITAHDKEMISVNQLTSGSYVLLLLKEDRRNFFTFIKD